MKRIFIIGLLGCMMLISLRASCGAVKPFSKPPVQAIKIEDWVYFHNMSITFDGRHYFTINGGNENNCILNEYDRNGEYMADYDVYLDGRSILYNPQTDLIYIKIYGTDLYEIDFEYEDAYPYLYDVFVEENSSPAISPDGQYLYELTNGKVRVIDFETGDLERTIKLEDWYDEHGYRYAIAASEAYIFVWGSEDEVLVYDLDGKYVNKIKMPRLGYSFSLTYCNNMLWVSKDADGASDGETGYWYGYRF